MQNNQLLALYHTGYEAKRCPIDYMHEVQLVCWLNTQLYEAKQRHVFVPMVELAGAGVLLTTPYQFTELQSTVLQCK